MGASLGADVQQKSPPEASAITFRSFKRISKIQQGGFACEVICKNEERNAMPRPRSEAEVEHYEAELATVTKKLEEARARFKARKAAEDHRRLLLAGQVAVQQMQAAPDGEFFRTMMGLLDRHTRSAGDRALFGLPALKNGHDNGDDANRGS
jgi:hypothetical protein